jgi:hypothetical protein
MKPQETNESSAFTVESAETGTVTSFFLGNCIDTHATLTAPTHGRNVPFGHSHYGNCFTSSKKPPKKARSSSAYSR